MTNAIHFTLGFTAAALEMVGFRHAFAFRRSGSFSDGFDAAYSLRGI